MAKTPALTLHGDVVRQLAFDDANDFFSDEELCVRYDLDIRQLKYVRSQPMFQKQVLDLKQTLADDGKMTMLQAKEYMPEVLTLYYDTMKDPDVGSGIRMKAADKIKELARVAGSHNGEIAQLPGGVGLIINTNLQLNTDLVGSYQATASALPKKGEPLKPPKTDEAVEAEFVEMEEPDRAVIPAHAQGLI